MNASDYYREQFTDAIRNETQTRTNQEQDTDEWAP